MYAVSVHVRRTFPRLCGAYKCVCKQLDFILLLLVALRLRCLLNYWFLPIDKLWLHNNVWSMVFPLFLFKKMFLKILSSTQESFCMLMYLTVWI